ncbi:EVE domain-containing protein [Candidatus Liberibacter sp.]|uniref:EVE domain-containing protein n=1 Tax=Candidatus Liberibacter sp. TaxID=34022 RepID=UPI0015F66AD8|nr:EVE domain-containing protein [Candidatus Liberibacter sp.]MBA5724162.1 EVE domain-containing protein [Candidatus Liberibacter sp.]
MSYWLFKSEPNVWSWVMQQGKGEVGEAWTGVRNYQARNNMRKMQIGEIGFFYHSNQGREIVGIVDVIRCSYPDPTADALSGWECVDIRAVCSMPLPVSLREIKVNPRLARMMLVVSARLSIQSVTEDEYLEVCRMGTLDNPPLSGYLEC